MSQTEQDATLGRVMREWKELHRQVVRFESELKAIGESFSALGRQLQANPPIINFDIESVEIDVAKLRQMAPVYTGAAGAEADKKAELDRLTDAG
jgi:hypothetical protein